VFHTISYKTDIFFNNKSISERKKPSDRWAHCITAISEKTFKKPL
jgi:hypothetical protein